MSRMTNAPLQVPDIRLAIIQADGEEREVVLDHRRDRYIVGRREALLGTSVDVPLPDRHVSRRHCEIAPNRKTGGWTLRDLLSSNGTRLEEELISDAPVPVFDGQKITVGLTSLTVNFDYESAAAAVAETPEALPAFAVSEGFEGGTILVGAHEASSETVMFAPGSAPPPPVEQESTIIVSPEEALRRVEPPAAAPTPAPTPAAPAFPAGAAPEDKTTIAASVAIPAPAPPPRDRSISLLRRAAPRPEEAPRPVPAPVSTRESRRHELQQAGFRGIALDLAADVFREEARLTAMIQQARETGKTFFRVLATDTTIKAHEEIYDYVAKSLGIELIKDEKYLMENAIEEKWLTYAQAGGLGAVLLAGGNGETVRFGTIDPYDVVTADWIATAAGVSSATPVLVLPTVFQAALQRMKNRTDDEDGSASVLVINLDSETEREVQLKVESVEVPKIVNYFLQKSFFDGASDIHIEPTEDFLLVRNRVDGILHELTTLPAAMHPEIISRIKIISGMDVAEKRRPQDGRIGTLIRENAIDVRVSSYPTIYGEKVVMRLLDKNALRPSPEHLGMISRDLRLLYDKLDAPFGLVMICGPTGSGKTTTLYSCLSYIDKKTKNVLTVEDPVEYRLKGVHQMQVNEKIGLTFASGLRTILRQDPDVIMVGECRDAETAGMAIQAALTGHIVFSTIHTNDAVGVIPRLIDMGVEPFLVANSVSLCIAQRLVRRVCRHCQAPEEGQSILEKLHNDGISDERLTSLGIIVDPDLTYVTGRGCVHCRNTGYQGRQAVFEIFEINQEARAEIVSPKFDANVMRRRARTSGMTTLIGHGLMLIDEGMTTHSEVIRVLGEAY
jgi:type II secretory ATPase GspE/PulE/Tfp pilus assembly ATPase PilB-like protein